MASNQVAFITGASSGIGVEFARQIASRGCDLILTARRQGRLDVLASELSDRYGVSAVCLAADLTDREAVKELESRIRAEKSLLFLVNNAGFGVSGSYIEQPVDRHQRMIDVHVSATVRFTHAALPGMINQRKGYIINVSSVAGFIPVKGGPGYSASKAYLNSFSTNLQSVLWKEGVRIQALCPGYTLTEFHNTADYKGNEREALPRWVWMTSEEVVRDSLRKLDSRKVIVIPGMKYRLAVLLLRSGVGEAAMSLRGKILGRN